MKFLLIALLVAAPLAAQENSELFLAMKLREESAREVKEKKASPAAIMTKLKAHKSATGLNVDSDAEFALSALDVGQRLLVAGEPEAAEKFFLEAEKSLLKLTKKTPDSEARDKAVYLQKLAFVRSQFLNKPKEAKADLDAALVLQPDNGRLKKDKERLVIDHGPSFSDNPLKR